MTFPFEIVKFIFKDIWYVFLVNVMFLHNIGFFFKKHHLYNWGKTYGIAHSCIKKFFVVIRIPTCIFNLVLVSDNSLIEMTMELGCSVSFCIQYCFLTSLLCRCMLGLSTRINTSLTRMIICTTAVFLVCKFDSENRVYQIMRLMHYF